MSFGKENDRHDTIRIIDSDMKSNLRRRLQLPRVQKCQLDVDIRCTVVGEDLLAVSCDDFVPPKLSVKSCSETPYSATLLLRGDRCNDFPEDSDLDFECQDFEMNSISSSHEGDWLYIIVTDAEERGIVYHRDWVRVGDNYDLSSDIPLQYGIQIHTFDDDQESNLLQIATYRSSLCSNPTSEIFSFLGGSQIVGFKDAKGSVVTPFKSSSYEVFIDVLISSQSHTTETTSIELESFTAMTSFQGLYELSDEAKGVVLSSENSHEAHIPLNVNLLEQQDHSLFVQVSGKAGDCVGTGFYRIPDARTLSN